MKIFLFIVGLLVPAIMFSAGWFMHKHPPRDINWVIGYRTARSMKNKDAWIFAQKKIGILWEKAGIFTMIASAVIMLPFCFMPVNALSVAMLVLLFGQMAVLLLTIVPVERALKKQFPDPQK